VIRGSPYDEDTFPVTKLVQAFQAAEDLPRAKIWGGSNMAAGSDSELGSGLHWIVLRDIAERIVRDAVRASRPTPVLVLTVSCDEIQTAMEQCGAVACSVLSLADARRTLVSGVPVQAIFCALSLPDGTVSDLAELSRQLAGGVPVIVCLAEIDGGWSDLLEAGAADVIAGPYLRDEVARVLKSLPRYGAVRPVLAGV
jgi:hypothetical protein